MAKHVRKTYICMDCLGLVGIQNWENLWKWIHAPPRGRVLDLHRSSYGDGTQLIPDVFLEGCRDTGQHGVNAPGKLQNNASLRTGWRVSRINFKTYTCHHNTQPLSPLKKKKLFWLPASLTCSQSVSSMHAFCFCLLSVICLLYLGSAPWFRNWTLDDSPDFLLSFSASSVPTMAR